jgi:vanadium-dependent haloperoxidase-like protein
MVRTDGIKALRTAFRACSYGQPRQQILALCLTFPFGVRGPFPEYISGHSTFSAAGAQILKLFTHSDKFGDSVTFRPGSSKTEPGLTPKQEVTLSWATFTDAANQAGISRRYGGIHFELADLVGRATGRLVADQAWEKALRFIKGKSEDDEELGEDER